MIKYIIVILLSLLSSAPAALVTAPKKGIEGNRFLFVVDTSSSMNKLESAGRQAVFDVVSSGIEGRMQAGDTFGLWTFGAEVKAGVFPMKTWAPDRGSDLAVVVGEFLKEQSSKGKPQLEVVIEKIEALARSVKDVDLLIFTSAGARFKGDETWTFLQQGWDKRFEEARKNKKAIIVGLAARGGRVAQATVTLHGETLQLAAPPERKTAQVTVRKSSATQAPLKAVREPIIIRGSTASPKPIEEIPVKFTPPVDPPIPEANPEPAPLPVLGTEKPVVQAPAPTPRESEPAREPQPELTVAAREPGQAAAPAASRTGSRLMIIGGASLMLIAGALGCWILVQIRSRNRTSYISRSMANRPGPGMADR